jgi:hypothetical protein
MDLKGKKIAILATNGFEQVAASLAIRQGHEVRLSVRARAEGEAALGHQNLTLPRSTKMDL